MSILYLHLHGNIMSTRALTFMSTHALGFTDSVNTAIPHNPVINAELFKIFHVTVLPQSRVNTGNILTSKYSKYL